MNKKKFYSATLFVALVLGSASISAKLLMASRSQSDSRYAAHLSRMSLDSKARVAKTGDENAVRLLADEVINQFAAPEAKEVLSQFKDRLVRAEMDYRRGREAGISERKLANSFNQLTRQLGVSESGRVSPTQLRYLRVQLITAFPNYVSQTSDQRPGKPIIANALSPLEAAGLTLVLINNKLSNEKFQLAPEEWAVAKHRDELAKWTAHRKGTLESERKPVRTTVERSRNPQLQRALEAHADEASQFIDRFLTELGIPRKESER